MNLLLLRAAAPGPAGVGLSALSLALSTDGSLRGALAHTAQQRPFDQGSLLQRLLWSQQHEPASHLERDLAMWLNRHPVRQVASCQLVTHVTKDGPQRG